MNQNPLIIRTAFGTRMFHVPRYPDGLGNSVFYNYILKRRGEHWKGRSASKPTKKQLDSYTAFMKAVYVALDQYSDKIC